MSAILNRRLYLEAAQTLAKTSQPTEKHIESAILTLQAVINDLTDGDFTLGVLEKDAKGNFKIAGCTA